MIDRVPGRLPAPCPLKPLKRISPSRFVGLLECPLREVWRASSCSPLLPRSPHASVGLIVHEMLKLAALGKFNGQGVAEISAVWESKVSDAETAMRSNWLESHFAPLRDSVRNLEVQKIRTINRVSDMTWVGAAVAGRSARLGDFVELWIETADHALGGYIDSVEESDRGLVLRDFKSGLINVPGFDSGEVKPEYVVQLELYCGMYFEVHNRWPDTLEIVPVVGDMKIGRAHV